MMRTRLYKIATVIIAILSTAFMAFISFYAFRTSFSNWEAENSRYVELPFPRYSDDLILNLIWFLLFLVFLYFSYTLISKRIAGRINAELTVYIFGMMLFIISCIWVIYAGTIHTSTDPGYIISAAYEAAINNDYSAFAPGGYMSEYHQNIGVFSVMYLLTGLNKDGWWFYQIINCLAYAGLFVMGYKLLRKSSADGFGIYIYCCMQFVCLPTFFYVSFCYGDLISICLIECAVYEVLIYMSKQGSGVREIVMIALLIFLSAFMRLNSVIVMIALLICAILRMFKDKRYFKPMIAVIAAVLAGILLYFAGRDILVKGHTDIADGIPAEAWIAMGLEQSTNGYGAYNLFSVHTFAETGYDTELTRQIARERINKMLAYYSADPKAALTFVKEKILWQWVDPSFNSLLVTCYYDGKGFIDEIYYGKYRAGILQFMNGYMNVIYIGMLYGCARILKLSMTRKTSDTDIAPEALFIPIVFIGHFLFCILWEAKPRYMFPCFVLMIPYASCGIGRLLLRVAEAVRGGIVRRGLVRREQNKSLDNPPKD